MQVDGTSGTNTNTSSNAMGLTGSTGDMFLQLLTTQLKSQDPISPMDPTQFVGQLVSFNTLGEIMQIRQLLGSMTDSSTSSSSAANGATGE